MQSASVPRGGSPRLTIGRLMIGIAVAGLFCAFLPWIRGPIDAILVVIFVGWVGSGYLAGRLTTRNPGRMSWICAAACALAVPAILLIKVYYLADDLSILLFLMYFMPMPSTAGVGLVLLSMAKTQQRALIRFAIAVGLADFCLTGDWPIELAFGISRPAMERLADRASRGEAISLPARAGVYTVVAIETVPGTDWPFLMIGDRPGSVPGGFYRGKPLKGMFGGIDPKRGGRWFNTPIAEGWTLRHFITEP